MDRVDAIKVIIGAVKGYTVADTELSHEDRGIIIDVSLDALRALGATNGEIKEAILTASFLVLDGDIETEKGA